MLQDQLKELEKEKKDMLETDKASSKLVKKLYHLKEIGSVSSWCLIYEFFGWRVFKNVKEVGAASGLAPTPYNCGNSNSANIDIFCFKLVFTDSIGVKYNPFIPYFNQNSSDKSI